MKYWVPFLILASCAISTAQISSATPAAGQAASHDYDLTVPASQAWTDTNLELHAGDLLQFSAASPSDSNQSAAVCDPRGASIDSSQTTNLPVPSAASGALIGKLHAEGAEAFLVGQKKEMKIEEAGHLYLGANADGKPGCAGSFAVKVHLVSSQSTAASSGPPASRGGASIPGPGPVWPRVDSAARRGGGEWLGCRIAHGPVGIRPVPEIPGPL